MAICPVQVIMDSDRFIADVLLHPGGGRRDFYSGNNEAFAEHRESITNQLNEIYTAQFDSQYSKIGYAKVRLIKTAWAKSHRPTSKLFTRDNDCNVVGGRHQGEMIVRISADGINRLVNGITANAEDKPRISPGKDGKMAERPSLWRCEVGTIDTITAYGPEDRLATSVSEVIEWIDQYGSCQLSISLFETPIPEQEMDGLSAEMRRMQSSFLDGLRSFSGIWVSRSRSNSTGKLITLCLTDNDSQVISLIDSIQRNHEDIISKDKRRYDSLFSFLANHPMVRSISIMPVIQYNPMPSFKFDGTEKCDIVAPSNESDYPIVAVVDSGVSAIYSDWIVDSWDNIHAKFRDTKHGTFVSGLLVNGQALNGPAVCGNPDGCKIVDLCMLPKADKYSAIYPNSIDDFLAELKVAIPEILSRVKVRIFNLSMNICMTRTSSDYGEFARTLDDLATRYNIVFVISAGNLITPRKEWSKDPVENISVLSNRDDDIVYMPGESVRNFTVAALNPTDLGLTSYSCRGKGANVAIKPDFVDIGGLGYNSHELGYGLYSIDSNGYICSSAGTSFSAPLISKTLASVEKQIEGTVSRETLMALAIQSAIIPEPFKLPAYQPYLKDLIGYGMPASAQAILGGDEHSIKLVIASRIKPRKQMVFNFLWPQCLTHNDKCFGDVKLTIVSTPRIDYNYGDEMIRQNLNVTLTQEKPDGKPTQSYLSPLYKDDNHNESGEFEWQLIEGSMKWLPTKVYQRSFKRGVKSMSPWTLRVTREDRTTPIDNEGIPFTIILTISDPTGEADVYNEIRQGLVSQGITVADIQTAARVAQRV